MARLVQFSCLGGPEVLRLVEAEVPEPGPREVRVRLRAVGLNRAELLFFQGRYLVQPSLPAKLGLEGSGVVDAVGAEVEGWSPGDVACIIPNMDPLRYGVCAELALVPANALVTKPSALSFPEAAAVWMAFLTAYGGLVTAGGLGTEAGHWVLISAASSSVGLAAIQVAKAHGARVIATTRSERKAARLRAAGADSVIATETESLSARVHAITGEHGVDLAFDAVGGPFLTELAEAAAPEGRIVIYGALALAETPFPLFSALAKGLTVRGFHVGHHLIRHANRFVPARDQILAGLAEGTYAPVIDRVFPLEQVVEAYRYLEGNAQVGKIVLEVA